MCCCNPTPTADLVDDDPEFEWLYRFQDLLELNIEECEWQQTVVKLAIKM